MLGVALDRHDVHGLGFVCVHVDREAEVRGQVAADLHHESPALSVRITSQCFCMKSVSGFEGCIVMWWTQCPTSASSSGMSFGVQSLVDRTPGRAAVIGAKRSGRGDRDEDPLRVLRTRR